MATYSQDYDEVRASMNRAKTANTQYAGLAAGSKTFEDRVMQRVREARINRGVDKISQDIGNVSGQLVSENPAIRDRMGTDVNPLSVDALTSSRRGQLMNTLTSLGNYQEQATGTIQDVVKGGVGSLEAAAMMKKAEADQANEEADNLMSLITLKQSEEKMALDKWSEQQKYGKETDEIDQYVQGVANGLLDIKDVPATLRGQVSSGLQNMGYSPANKLLNTVDVLEKYYYGNDKGFAGSSTADTQDLAAGANIFERIGTAIGSAFKTPKGERRQLYLDKKKALVGAFKELGGEVGRLTDQDITRLSNLIPNTGDSYDQSVEKFSELKREINALKGAGLTSSSQWEIIE